MAHNISRAKKAVMVRESELGCYSGFFLTCECPCRHVGWVQVDALIGARGADMARKPVGWIVQRLRCKACGVAPARVFLTNGTDEKPVWGPDAF